MTVDLMTVALAREVVPGTPGAEAAPAPLAARYAEPETVPPSICQRLAQQLGTLQEETTDPQWQPPTPQVSQHIAELLCGAAVLLGPQMPQPEFTSTGAGELRVEWQCHTRRVNLVHEPGDAPYLYYSRPGQHGLTKTVTLLTLLTHLAWLQNRTQCCQYRLGGAFYDF